MVHCITLAVPVSGLRFATALDWYSQGDTVDHINPRSVLSIYLFIYLYCGNASSGQNKSMCSCSSVIILFYYPYVLSLISNIRPNSKRGKLSIDHCAGPSCIEILVFQIQE